MSPHILVIMLQLKIRSWELSEKNATMHSQSHALSWQPARTSVDSLCKITYVLSCASTLCIKTACVGMQRHMLWWPHCCAQHLMASFILSVGVLRTMLAPLHLAHVTKWCSVLPLERFTTKRYNYTVISMHLVKGCTYLQPSPGSHITKSRGA